MPPHLSWVRRQFIDVGGGSPERDFLRSQALSCEMSVQNITRKRGDCHIMRKSMGVLFDDGSHGIPLLLHIPHQLELGTAAVQILLGIVDAEVIVAV